MLNSIRKEDELKLAEKEDRCGSWKEELRCPFLVARALSPDDKIILGKLHIMGVTTHN